MSAHDTYPSHMEPSYDALPAPEPTYLDKLYIQFGQSMTHEQHAKFMELTRERKDYLFNLWLQKKGYV